MSAPADVEAFIETWSKPPLHERAIYQSFTNQLCRLLGVAAPHEGSLDPGYTFDAPVRFKHDDGSTSQGFIDCYKKGAFVLEAKQSQKAGRGQSAEDQYELALQAGAAVPLKRPDPRANFQADARASAREAGFDRLMRAARNQAEGYAKALDEWPPFLVIVDVGRVIELYADFSRQGKNYAQFPDRRGFRIALADLRDEAVRARLKAVWDDPMSLDPASARAEVTNAIAALLARATRSMERRGPQQDRLARAAHAGKVADFLMQCLFAMFAEDVGLLPERGFQRLIEQYRGKADRFHLAAERFFAAMDRGGHSDAIAEDIRHFNGGIFHGKAVVQVTEDELALLQLAAQRDWRNVEPAIFGTLLEQALDPRERASLGAHYTPRAYVERLVVPTVIEPLREDFDAVETAAIGEWVEGRPEAARKLVRAFHDRLCATRVLDPACGTGNFLYVALELMKRLEGKVLDLLRDLGEPGEPLNTVGPGQFWGLEKNARAAPIAELVLWIGYLQWWFRTRERGPDDPVLRDHGTIRVQDALLAYDREALLTGPDGRLITRQDPDARLEVYRYLNPRPAAWPEAEFIVGNPPFIGGKDLRARLGDGYAEALWASRRNKFRSADLVMYWWDHAAELLTRRGTKLRRFGFVTTNSLTQKFSRRVLEAHLAEPAPALRQAQGEGSSSGPASGSPDARNRDPHAELVKAPGSRSRDPHAELVEARGSRRRAGRKHGAGVRLVYAIPDHPWVKGQGRADVRIAMTVAEAGAPEGTERLLEVAAERELNSDAPVVVLTEMRGAIAANLTVGADVTQAAALLANAGLCSPGVKLHGAGFIVSPQQAHALGLGRVPDLDKYIRPYVHGRDLADRSRDAMVIDLYPLNEEQVRQRFPEVYQHVRDRVKPERDTNNMEFRRVNWWWFGATHAMYRSFTAGLPRFLVTPETAKHRWFTFVGAEYRADNKLVAFGFDDAYHAGLLSSRSHVVWALAAGGWLGVGNDPVYVKRDVFDPFPFPAATEAQRTIIRDLAEELDALRKAVIAEHEFLTMTRLYNVRERLVRGEALTDADRAIYDAGRVGVIHELHTRIDAAVADAYGWPGDLPDAEILTRLVALNRERAAEEAAGHVRWLRPDYQAARFAPKAAAPLQTEAELHQPIALPALPARPDDLARALLSALQSEGRPVDARRLAARFRGGEARAARTRVADTLAVLAVAGQVRQDGPAWFAPRR